MPRDYRRKSKTKASPSPVRWLLSGFGLGLIAAFMMYLQMKPPTEAEVAQPSTTTQPQSIADDDNPAPANTETVSKLSDTLPSLPPQGGSNYEFYEELPEFVLEVPAAQQDTATPQQASRPQSTRASDTVRANTSYMLQTGSFRSHTDADRRKAQIGLMGFSSTIEKVNIKGENWFRVFIGPTRDKEELEYTRSRLRRDGIDVLLLREKPQ